MDSASIRRATIFAVPLAATPVLWTLLLGFLVAFFCRGAHDQQRAVEVATLLACAVLALLQRRPAVPASAFTAPLCFFLLLGTISATQAFSPRYAAYEVASFFLLGMVALQAGREIAAAGSAGFIRAMQAIGAICAMYSIKFVVAYFGSLALGTVLDMYDFTPGFSNVRHFNHVQTATLPFLAFLFHRAPKKSMLRGLWLGVAVLWWVAMIVTEGRGSMLGLAAGSVCVAFACRRSAFPYLKAFIWTAIIGVAVYVIFLIGIPVLIGHAHTDALGSAAARTTNQLTSGRMEIWRQVIRMIGAHPWLGVGPMQLAHYAKNTYLVAHPHNWVLQIAAEWGLPALACLCVVLGRAVMALFGMRRRIPDGDSHNEAVFAVMLATGTALMVDGLVSGTIVMPHSQLAIALYLACVTGWAGSLTPPPETAAPQRTRAVMAVLAGAAAFAVLNGVFPELPARVSNEPLDAATAAANPGNPWPRLWEAGYF